MSSDANFHIIEGGSRPQEAGVSPLPGCRLIEGPSCDRLGWCGWTEPQALPHSGARMGVPGDTCLYVESVSGPDERLALAQLPVQLWPSRPRTAPPLACPLPAQPATSLPPPSRLSRGDESPIKRPGSPRRRHHQPAGRRLHCFALIGGQELVVVLMRGGCWLAASLGWWRAAARERVGRTHRQLLSLKSAANEWLLLE